MANTTITIGPYILPACSHYNQSELPQYAESTSLNGIIWRDKRTVERVYLISLGWEALTPAEKVLVDNAWNTIVSATPTSNTSFVGLTNTPFTIRPDEKSNDYTYTGYMGAVTGTGFTTLYDATLIFRVTRVEV